MRIGAYNQAAVVDPVVVRSGLHLIVLRNLRIAESNHVTLVMTLEDKFAVKFTTREVMGWRNVGQMLDCLQAKLDK